MDWGELVVALVGVALSGGAGAIIGARAQARKTEAEATRTLLAAVNESLVRPLRERVADLEQDLEQREVQWDRERRSLYEGIRQLISQLVEHDLVPCWTPPHGFEEEDL
jgi:hypothetical protein